MNASWDPTCTVDNDDDDDDDEAPLLVSLEDPNTVVDNNHASATVIEEQEEQQQVEPMQQELPPCPVTILTGALGSGKTTLIRYILQSPQHQKRIAVIENEFGEGLSIETLIATDGVDNSSLSDFIELPNGCVCCTVKDSLVETLENLLHKRTDLDYILIEASGMANPGPIASIFWLDRELESRLRLDGIVTLVDAHCITRQLQHVMVEAQQQIAYADRILVNKVDLLVDPSTSVEEVTNLIRNMNPTALLQTTTFSQVPDLDFILHADCYNEQYATRHDNLLFNETVEKLVALMNHNEHHHHQHEHEHHHEHEYGHDHEHCLTCQQQEQQQQQVQEHEHTSAVTTVAFLEKGTMDMVRLNAWLASVLWPNQDEKDEVLRARLEQQLQQQPPMEVADPKSTNFLTNQSPQQQQEIFRIKGVVSIQCDVDKTDEAEWTLYCDPRTGVDKRRYIVQAVYDIWDIHPSQEEFGSVDNPTTRDCKLVVIGRNLQRNVLLQGFQSCLIDPV